ncbi:MAG: hypothetical protein Q4D98_05340 [Planctomycetia bacterium]|nr:hypothetical protein [Planctomycetia bacterium]
MRIFSTILAIFWVFSVLVAAEETPRNGRVLQSLARQMGQPIPETLRESIDKIPPKTKKSFPVLTAQNPSLLFGASEAEEKASPAVPMVDRNVVPVANTEPASADPFAGAAMPAELPLSLDAENVALPETPVAEAPVVETPVAETMEIPRTEEAVVETTVETPSALQIPEAPTPETMLEAPELPPMTTNLDEIPAVETVETPAVPDALPVVEKEPASLPAMEEPASELPVAEFSVSELPAAETEGTVGTGKPGDPHLEGVQAVQLAIEKIAPAEIQVGSPSTWTINVRNEGTRDAVGVQIHDCVPKGAKLAGTNPQATRSENGMLTWNVGTMPAGTMATVKMELIPTEEGAIGSVASVTTRSEASAKSVATRPMLTVETLGESEVLLGNATELTIVVSNPGSGITRNVVLSEKVPAELQFEGGAELLYKVGDLRPGETKTTKLPLTAVRPGQLTNVVEAVAEPNLRVGSNFQMTVTAPVIHVQLEGPARRFLEKEGTYKIQLGNSGTAAAKNVELKVALPPGMEFVKANNAGTYLPETRRIAWRLEELPAKDSAEAEFVVRPQELGEHAMKFEAVADICSAVQGEKKVSVEGIAALMFQVSETNDPVQVGEETTYKIHVVNQGSKEAKNVQVVTQIPAGLQVTSVDASRNASGELVFATIPILSPKAEKVFTFVARGAQSGDQRVVVKLSSDEFRTPIVKEESTRVYAD